MPVTNRAARFVAAALAAGLAFAVTPAQAQSAVCAEGTKMLEQRRALGARITGKKRVDPRTACSVLGQMVSNGNAVIKWAETNKDWCQIPDEFFNGLKADNAKVTTFRGQACKAAAQQAQLEKQAKERGAQGGRSGMWGGDGISGTQRMPQGAL
jgi:hypothetical protein